VAFAIAGGLGGSGFIAAFIGGLAFGRASGEHGAAGLFTEETGDLLAAVVWIGFGALVIGPVVSHITWQVVIYAVLSLTVVRMVPVALALLRSGARAPTVAFIGWFGPRGLASLVFALLVIERGVPEQTTLLATVAVTVGLSVILHGITSVPFVARYQRWYERHVASRPQAEEAAPASLPRQRRQFGLADLERLACAGRSEQPGISDGQDG
jgi:NhaP-type Na+/H+ or K+/H+ antiporter